mgnify:CR=1 FL=1
MRTVGTAPGTSTMYLPTTTVADMRGMTGFGLINPGDHWLIDRKWGNPGTATIMKRPDGQWGLRGPGFGAWGGGDIAVVAGFSAGALILGVLAGIFIGRATKKGR